MKKHAEEDEFDLCHLIFWNRIPDTPPTPHVCTYQQGSNCHVEVEAQDHYIEELFPLLKPSWVSSTQLCEMQDKHIHRKAWTKLWNAPCKRHMIVVFPQAGLCAAEWFRDLAAAVDRARESSSCLGGRRDIKEIGKTSKHTCCLLLAVILHVPVRGHVQKRRDLPDIIPLCRLLWFFFHHQNPL